MPEAADRAQEIERIRAEYLRRDAGDPAAPAADLAWLMHVQALEWRLLRELAASGARLEGADVLDVGTGTGFRLARMVEYGAASGTGVDLMEERVAEAHRRRPQL